MTPDKYIESVCLPEPPAPLAQPTRPPQEEWDREQPPLPVCAGAPCGGTERRRLNGIEISELVDKIIIGPTLYESATRNALWFMLNDAVVAAPQNRIVYSGVPLRT
jgi:hypothetical protein